MRTDSWLSDVSVVFLMKPASGVLLTCVSHKSLLVIPSNVGWCDTVSLVVDHDFNLAALHDANTGVSSSKIDSNNYISKTRSAAVLKRRSTQPDSTRAGILVEKSPCRTADRPSSRQSEERCLPGPVTWLFLMGC